MGSRQSGGKEHDRSGAGEEGYAVLVLHETLLVPFLMYGSETMLWKERSRIRAVQMDSLRGLLGIRRMRESQMHE